MKTGIKTYNCREVIVTLGSHIVSGYAEDSFVTRGGGRRRYFRCLRL